MTELTVQLDPEQMQLLERVCQTTGVEASVAVADALAIYESTLGADDYRRHFTPVQIAAIEAGLTDARSGRTVANKEVFTELRAKYGW